MAGKVRKFFRDQPFLAGCAGCLVTSAVICGGLAALSALGVVQIISCAGAGLDQPRVVMQEAAEAGYGMQTQWYNGQVTYFFQPMEPKEVSCADLEAIIFPHLTGELETIRLESISYVQAGDGSYSQVPIDCTYSGFPSASPPPEP